MVCLPSPVPQNIVFWKHSSKTALWPVYPYWGLVNLKQLQTASAFHFYIFRENKPLCHVKLLFLFVFFRHLANYLLNWVALVASVYPIVCDFPFRTSSHLLHDLIISLLWTIIFLCFANCIHSLLQAVCYYLYITTCLLLVILFWLME